MYGHTLEKTVDEIFLVVYNRGGVCANPDLADLLAQRNKD